MRTVGTVVRGIRAPIIKEGDDLASIVVESVLTSAKAEGFELADRDVIGITESLVARAQGNYAPIEQITQEINEKFPGDELAVLFPILSRNRFSPILEAIANTKKQIYLILNYPADEVGNHLMDIEKMDDLMISPLQDVLTEEQYRELFGENVTHPFTGIDYVDMYKKHAVDGNITIYLANDPKIALQFTKNILVANVHDRCRTKRILKRAGADVVFGLEDLLTEPSDSHGYNPEFGLLGSNKATNTTLKLFPRECQQLVNDIQQRLKEITGYVIEVMVYGDGAFKDPRGKIWELADPVVSPGFTEGLIGTPSEIKLKYLADNEFHSLEDHDAVAAIRSRIKNREDQIPGEDDLGTTPRQLTDLLGSLCDLTSGSGDKGTPIVLVQKYFDNYATE